MIIYKGLPISWFMMINSGFFILSALKSGIAGGFLFFLF